jgi:glutamate/tyrosine decarboxylase-like PLP-dependent enzyme
MGCSLGTTYTCAFDNIEIIGKLCKEYDIILSVDAAYAGIYQILPEKAYLFKHQELIDVYMVNMAKSGLIGLVGAVLFVKDKKSFIRLSGKEKLINSVCTNVFSNSDDIIDYKDWSVGFGRKNNAFNLYLTLKLFGVNKY